MVSVLFKTPAYLKQFSSLTLSALPGLRPLLRGRWRGNPHPETKELPTTFSALLEIILRVENIFSHLVEWLAAECCLCHKRLPIHSSTHFSKQISVLHVLQVSFTEQLLSNLLSLLSLSLCWSGCFILGQRICYRHVFQKGWVPRSTTSLYWNSRDLHSSSDSVTGWLDDLSFAIHKAVMRIKQLLVCQTHKSSGWAVLKNSEAWLLIACMIIPKHMQSHNIAFIWHSTAWKHREESTVLL